MEASASTRALLINTCLCRLPSRISSPTQSFSWNRMLSGLETLWLPVLPSLCASATLNCSWPGGSTSRRGNGQPVRQCSQERQVRVKALAFGLCGRDLSVKSALKRTCMCRCGKITLGGIFIAQTLLDDTDILLECLEVASNMRQRRWYWLSLTSGQPHNSSCVDLTSELFGSAASPDCCCSLQASWSTRWTVSWP